MSKDTTTDDILNKVPNNLKLVAMCILVIPMTLLSILHMFKRN